MSIKGNSVDVVMVDPDGIEHVIRMHVCDRKVKDKDKCRKTTWKLVAKVPHVDCDPLILRPENEKRALIEGESYDISDFGSDCGDCSTLYVLMVYDVEIKCLSPIQICKCTLVGEVGCNQVSCLVPMFEIQGNTCPTIGGQVFEDQSRKHRKAFRIYTSKAEAMDVCAVDGTIIAKTNMGQIEIKAENFEGDCPFVTGYLDKKTYKTIDADA